MLIRKAFAQDMPRILKIYETARSYMAANGNPTQWGTTNPPEETLWSDIRAGQLYVAECDNTIHGVFALMDGPDPTYGRIDGQWHSDETYGVIHRIASSGEVRGILKCCLAFAAERHRYLRIDTHENNKTMQHLLEKFGFNRCGIIYLANGDPRIAYDR